MNFWYNKTVYKTTKTIVKNQIGQLIEIYKKDDTFKADIQPIDEKSYKYTWGNDIKSRLQMFCNEDLLVNEILVNDNKTYKIEKKIKWDDYNIYAILESDTEIYEEDK